MISQTPSIIIRRFRFIDSHLWVVQFKHLKLAYTQNKSFDSISLALDYARERFLPYMSVYLVLYSDTELKPIIDIMDDNEITQLLLTGN